LTKLNIISFHSQHNQQHTTQQQIKKAAGRFPGRSF